jgi:hypothetical protein
MFGQRNKMFSFPDCKFANEAAKESTARMVIFREFSVLNSYTIESTFYAAYNPKIPTLKKKRDIEEDLQIKAEDLKQIGHDLCLTINQIVQSKILRKKLLSDNLTSNLMVGQTKDQIVIIPSATAEKGGSAANRQSEKERDGASSSMLTQFPSQSIALS